jgi:soluble lytic murein transglycosylase-like protein
MTPGLRCGWPGLCLLAVLTNAAPARAAEDELDRLVAEAQRYEHAEGVPRDTERAMLLYCRAADRGHAGAAFDIGWMYFNGRGVPQDDAAAARWFAAAAGRGHAQAARLMQRLGLKAATGEVRCAAGTAAAASPPTVQLPAAPEVEPLVRELAAERGLDPLLVLAVIAVESAFHPKAVSPKGALGLMQLMPATAQRFGIDDATAVRDNLRGGMDYLRWLLSLFRGDVTLAVAAYNAGENRVLRHGGVPPIAETQDYVRRIHRYYGAARHPFDPAVAAGYQPPAAAR